MTRARLAAPAVNHYEVLGVAPTATTREIRESFRRLVLEAHPDKNPERADWSERRIRELIEAFDVVGNEDKRLEFDRLLGATRRHVRKKQDKPFFFYKQDPEARALLILHHLLNGRAESAAELLEEMEGRLGESFLFEHLDRPDYLDCLFLLGEHHTEKREYDLAVDRLKALYSHEQESRFPRHYMDQVVDRLKDLYLRKLPRSASALEAMAGLRAAKDLGLTKAEEIQRLRRLAELAACGGRLGEARRCMARLVELSPGDPGALKVQKILDSADGQ